MPRKPRLLLTVQSREASRARFLAATKGQRFIDISAVPYDPDRTPSEERALRTRAVFHAREMLGLKGFTLNAQDEALAQRFIDGAIDEAELMGKKYDIAPR